MTPPRRPRTLSDAKTEAEAAFKSATAKVVEVPAQKATIPGVKELVSLRIDQDVLEHFQDGGPGWQDRINSVLRKAAGKDDRIGSEVMTAKDKHTDKPKNPAEKSHRPAGGHDDLYEDGDMATPKRDFNEDEIKEEEDKRL